MHTLSPDAVYGIASLTCAAAGAICDVRTRRIPNGITGLGLLLGLLLHLALGGWRSLLSSAIAGFVAGLLFLLFYLAGGMGAGDVKLIAAVGCLAGAQALPQLLVGTAIAGGLSALLLALVHRRIGETMTNVARLLAYHGKRGLQPHPELNLNNGQGLRLPYGLAIAAGAASSACNLLVR
ncbi:MAG TPA: A24 family peptidase [Chloroflexota bacterium]|nr:A24 family peptidase [Chloroflexota bacterium]